ncbi:hypothetical protein [Pseudoalteromonas sp. ASV78]|uniref:hypothetical protein n=1 Tax=Pseudoalteromonas sp. ASV78 TaxID=3397851 RepID=UPI0039FC94A4
MQNKESGYQNNTLSFTPWSLVGVEGVTISDTISAVSDATGTATHNLNQPKDLNADDS